MTKQLKHKPGPMPYTQAVHLLNPLRNLLLSPKKLVRRLDLKRNSSVLELGAGPGFFSPAVARAVPEGKLVLVDIQQEMLDMARKRLEKKGMTNVEYRRGDAVSLPGKDGSFDAVLLVAVLGEVPDKRAALREIRRVLRPDGLLSITEQWGDPDRTPSSQMKSLVTAEDFRHEITYHGLGNYTISFRK